MANSITGEGGGGEGGRGEDRKEGKNITLKSVNISIDCISLPIKPQPTCKYICTCISDVVKLSLQYWGKNNICNGIRDLILCSHINTL